MTNTGSIGDTSPGWPGKCQAPLRMQPGGSAPGSLSRMGSGKGMDFQLCWDLCIIRSACVRNNHHLALRTTFREWTAGGIDVFLYREKLVTVGVVRHLDCWGGHVELPCAQLFGVQLRRFAWCSLLSARPAYHRSGVIFTPGRGCSSCALGGGRSPCIRSACR